MKLQFDLEPSRAMKKLSDTVTVLLFIKFVFVTTGCVIGRCRQYSTPLSLSLCEDDTDGSALICSRVSHLGCYRAFFQLYTRFIAHKNEIQMSDLLFTVSISGSYLNFKPIQENIVTLHTIGSRAICVRNLFLNINVNLNELTSV